MTSLAFSWTIFCPLDHQPPSRNAGFQAIPPATLYTAKRAEVNLPMPAMKGAKVQTIGMNLARMMVSVPYRSQKLWAPPM
jgi:hypothetical protein